LEKERKIRATGKAEVCKLGNQTESTAKAIASNPRTENRRLGDSAGRQSDSDPEGRTNGGERTACARVIRGGLLGGFHGGSTAFFKPLFEGDTAISSDGNSIEVHWKSF